MGKEHKQNIFTKVAMIRNKTKEKKQQINNSISTEQQYAHRTPAKCPLRWALREENQQVWPEVKMRHGRDENMEN